jgi:hypothetical protein
MSAVSELQSQINTLRAQLAETQSQFNQLVDSGAPASAKSALSGQIASINNQLVGLQNDLAVAQSAEATTGGTASTGEITTAAKQTESGQATTPVYSQDQVNKSTDTGTNAEVRTLDQTQTTPQPQQTAANTNPLNIQVDDNGGAWAPTSSNGVAKSVSDDNSNGINTVSGTNTVLNTAQTGRVTPQANILDRYASYTYALSLYLITPKQFDALKDGPPNFSTWMLLIQDGGAATTQYSANGAGGRSPYFSLDYYMDNLTLTSQMPLSGSLSAHNVTDLEFKVYEPAGLTLPNALAQAVKDFYKQNNVAPNGKEVNYNLAHYVMVIRFYGYDQNGNLVDVGNTTQAAGTAALSPGINNAVVTKYYPFMMKKLDFKLGSKGVEYTIHGAPYIYMLGASAKRGSIPQQFNLVGATVGTILSGVGAGSSTVIPDDGRTTTPNVPKAAPQGTRTPKYAKENLGNAVVTGGYSDATGIDFGQLSG